MHEDYVGEIDDELHDMEELKAVSKDLVQRIFVMDHDFVCLQKQRNEEYDAQFALGVDYYLCANWPQAKDSFEYCRDKILLGEEIKFKDGTLTRFWEMINAAKVLSPEDWALGVPNAFDWDKKPIPPEVDY